MKAIIHKSLSALMAFVVLFTTMSFTVDMHYCGDSLVDYSFFTKVEGCAMEKMQVAEGCEKSTITKKSCCSNEKIVKDGNDDLKQSSTTLSFEQQLFVVTFYYTYVNLFEGLDQNIIPFKDYSPPFIERDVQMLYETYLI